MPLPQPPFPKIPHSTILTYWHKHQTRVPDDIYQSLRKLHNQQYPMMCYLMKAEGDGLNEAEHQMMYYIGTFILEVVMGEFPTIPQVPEEVMLQARELNVSMLGFLGSEDRPQNFRSSMDDIIDTHPQSDLLRFVVEFLMRDPACQESVREENVWILFAHLKIVLDALGNTKPL